MNFKFFIILSFLLGCKVLSAQTFTNPTGGAIPDNNTQKCFPITVSGVGIINGNYGLGSVCLNIVHPYVSDLEIVLRAPDGTTVPLSIHNGGTGQNYNGTCFAATASTSIVNGIAPFGGTFMPDGNLNSVNNNQNANGVWNLCITDVSFFDAGTLSNFSLTFSTNPVASDDPCTASPLSVNSNCIYVASTNVGATASAGVPNPGCANYTSGDIWFKAIVPPGGAINIDTQDGTMTNSGMAIYSGTCNNLTLLQCDDNSSLNGNMSYIAAIGLIPGSTVWIRIWGNGNNNYGTFGICVTTPPIPTVQDCPAAIPLCQNVYNEPISYSGTGNLPNEINPASSCLANGERADVWYTFNVQGSGLLSFTITPTLATEDYDWAVYNLTNATCSDIYSNASLNVSCNYSGTAGPTGPNGGSALNNQGQLGTPFNAKIPVTAGQTYAINVSNYSLSANGYQINFGASTAQIFDNKPPTINSAIPANPCGTNQLSILFSENVKCSTIQPADFTVTGPGGPYTVTAFISSSCGANC